MISFLENIVSQILSIISDLGYLGIFFGMAIESSLFPFPSEIILVPAGILISQGKMNTVPIFLSSVFGSLAGALFNYFLALKLGRKAFEKMISKFGRILFITEEHLKKSDTYFKNHGDITTFLGRLIPGVRQLISLPAGFSKMNLIKFCIFTSLGAGFWSLILIFTGYLAGRNLNWILENQLIVTMILLILCIIIAVIYILVRNNKRSNVVLV